jgi:light-regulated signal transduction histidine kinase (bacteriophytochrome)
MVEALVRRADEILRLNEELSRRNEDLDTFAHVAAHDLKEPLRGIRNFAQFLDEDYRDQLDDEGRSQLATIVRLSSRLETLLDSLLRFARLTREDMVSLRCDLGPAVDEACQLVASAIERSGGKVVVKGVLPSVTGDEHLVTEAFVNLFTNALKYNESPVPTIEIERMPDTEEGRVVIAVRDNGIGIPERHLQTVFTLFKRLHGKEAFGGGTGMGLTIVKRAIERLGGRVSLESTPGQGSTFSLEFLP